MHHAVAVVALEEDVAVFGETGVGVVVVVPGDDKAAVGRGRDAGLVLVLVGAGIDAELGACRAAIGRVTLAVDPGAAAVLAVAAPGDDPAAACQGGDLGFVLGVAGDGVDAELPAHRVVVAVVALAVDAPAAAVGAALVGPHHHIATVAHPRDGGVNLVARHGGVDHLLQPELHRAVGFRPHVDGDGAGLAGAAITIGDADADGAVRDRVAHRVGVGQAFDDLFHRVHRRVGVELHRELVAVGAVADDAADGHALVADHRAGHADLPRARAFAADAQLILAVQALLAQLVLRAVAGEVVHLQQAAVEVGRVHVLQAHASIDELRHGVDEVLTEAHAAVHVDQQRVGLPHQRGGVAEDLLVNVVLARGGVVVVERHDEAPIGQCGQGRLAGVVAGVRVEVGLDLAVHALARGAELLHKDLVRTLPGHHPAAGGQRRHGRVELVARDGGVDAELGAHGAAVGGIALAEDAAAAAVLPFRAPGDEEAAVVQGRDDAVVLRTGGVGVDAEGRAQRVAAGVEALAVDAIAVAVGAVIRPCDDEAAAHQAGDARVVLRHRAQAGRIGPGFAALHHASGVVALEEDVAVLGEAGVGVVIVVPGDDKAAIGRGRDAGLVLVLIRAGVHTELGTLRPTRAVVALRIDASPAAVLVVAAPRDHETTAGQPHHRGVALRVRRVGVDLELGAQGHAIRGKALGVDAGIPTVLRRGGGPHRDVAAVGQARHGGVALRVGAVGVDAFVVEDRLHAVELRRDVDLDAARHAGAAITVGDADAHRARGCRVAEGVGVGQAFDHPLHGRHAGVRVEGDGQLAAIHAVAGDGADGHATEADGVAGHAHLTDAVALVAHAELVLRRQARQAELVLQRVAGEVVHLQHATVEVGGVDIRQPHHGVDQLRCGVDQVLVEGDAGGHIDQLRVGLPGEVGRFAEELLVDVVGAAVVVVVVAEGDHEAAVGQGHHAAGVAVAVVVQRVDALFTIQPCPAGVVGLHPLGAVAEVADGKAAVRQARHRRQVLRARRVGVDAELAAHEAAISGITLAEDAGTAAVLALGVPHDDPAAVVQRGHGRLRLRAGGVGVGAEHRAHGHAGGVEALALHAGVAGVAGCGVVGPGDDEAAAGQRRDAGFVLRCGAQTRRVGSRLAALRNAGGVVALEQDVAVLGEGGVGVVVVVPGDDETAVGGAGDRGLVLVLVGAGVDQELAAQRGAVIGEALRVDTGAAAVLPVAAPGDDVAAPDQAGHCRFVLAVAGVAVDAELGADRHALRIETLRVDAFAPAVLAGAFPDGDVATVRQARRGRVVLRGRCVGVDALVAEQRRAAVGLGRDVDDHRARDAGAAVAVGQADADGAAGHGRRGVVGVGQVLQHRLHQRHGGVGVEAEHEVGPVQAVAGDGADGHATDADDVAGDTHLPGPVALVADAELVLQRGGVGELRRLDVAVARDHAHPQRAAAEVGGIGVDQADAGIDELRRAVDQVLREGDAGCEVGEHGRCRGDQAARRAQHLLEDAVGVGGVALFVVTRPDHHGLAARQADDLRLVLRAAAQAVEHLHAVDLVACSVELLGHHVLVAAAQGSGGVAVPGDDEAAAIQPGHTGLVVLVAWAVDGVDQQLEADLVARGIETLGLDVVAVGPHRDEAATAQGRDVHAELAAGCGGVDADGGAHLGASVGEELRHDAAAAGVAAGVGPHRDKAAAAERGQLRLVLRGTAGGVEREFGAEHAAVGREALRQHVVEVRVAGVVAAVGDDESAVRQAQHGRLVLVADGAGGGAELSARRAAVGVVALGVDAVAAAAVLARRTPGDDEAAARQGADGRLGLLVECGRVDLELGADGGAIAGVALCEHPVVVAILAPGGGPGDDVAAVAAAQQARHGGVLLLVALEGVDLLLGAQQRLQRRGVRLGRDVDGDIAHRGRVAGAVGQADAHRAAGQRVAGEVAVAQVLDHALDGRLGGSGLPGDVERAAVRAVERGAEGADGDAAEEHVGAHHAHLPGSVALVLDGELVVAAARAAQVGDGELAVGPVAAGVVQLHIRVDEGAGQGLGLGEGERGGHILQAHHGGAEARLDADLHRARVAGAAITVGQAHADVAVGGAGRRGAVHVGDVLAHGAHRGGGGAGVEGHHQVGRARAPAGEGADHGAADADVGTAHAHLASAVALVAQAQGVVGAEAGREEDRELAAVEVGRVVVAHAEVAVDHARRAGVEVGVGRCVGQRAQQAHVAQHGVGTGARKFRSVAEDLRADLVSAAAGTVDRRDVVIAVRNDEVAVAQVGDGRLVFGAVRQRRQLAFAIQRHGRIAELADVDVVLRAGAGDVGVVVVPGDDEAAGAQPDHFGLVLVARRALVDEELATHLGTRGVQQLPEDARTVAILRAIAAPHDDEAAVGQRRHAGLVLAVHGLRVHREQGPEQAGARVVEAAEHAPRTAIQSGLVLPDDQQVAIGLRRHVGQLLRAGLRGGAAGVVHPQFGRYLNAVVVEATQINVLPVEAGGALRA